ncbi:MAG: HAD family hydrolase, partial [Sphingobacteriales bacterium]
VLLIIAFGSLLFWLPVDWQRGLSAFTAVLIVACPCALALSTPFTMSAALGVFDRNRFYLKNTAVVEQLARINTIVLDKTGTITTGDIDVTAAPVLSKMQQRMVYTACINSSHPISRRICKHLGGSGKLPFDNYEEIPGKGISVKVNAHQMLIGSAGFLGVAATGDNTTSVHVIIDGAYIGAYRFQNAYRDGLNEVTALKDKKYQLFLLSGDNDKERDSLKQYFNSNAIHFNQSPQQKLDFIRIHQLTGKKVMMIGDGLNDAGALKQSDLGVAVTDNVNNFSPGSDAILDGRSLSKLPAFLDFSKDTVKVIYMSFLLSLTYNIIGLTFAVTGKLSPLTAAILMPLSTATIISFTSIATHVAARRRKLS